MAVTERQQQIREIFGMTCLLLIMMASSPISPTEEYDWHDGNNNNVVRVMPMA